MLRRVAGGALRSGHPGRRSGIGILVDSARGLLLILI